jgi:hypothetical protein
MLEIYRHVKINWYRYRYLTNLYGVMQYIIYRLIDIDIVTDIDINIFIYYYLDPLYNFRSGQSQNYLTFYYIYTKYCHYYA